MLALRTLWKSEGDRLICRWSDVKQSGVPYTPAWMQVSSGFTVAAECASLLVRQLDFTRLSPFAGKGWFERSL